MMLPSICCKQRQEAKEQAKAGGLKDKSTETDGFINVQ